MPEQIISPGAIVLFHGEFKAKILKVLPECDLRYCVSNLEHDLCVNPYADMFLLIEGLENKTHKGRTRWIYHFMKGNSIEILEEGYIDTLDFWLNWGRQ